VPFHYRIYFSESLFSWLATESTGGIENMKKFTNQTGYPRNFTEVIALFPAFPLNSFSENSVVE